MNHQRFKIVLPWAETFHPDGQAILRAAGEVHASHARLSDSDWLDLVSDADAVLVVGNTEYVNESVLARAKKLKVVSRFGVGYDTIDVRACTKHGVLVTTAPGNVPAVADLAFGLILSVARNIPQAAEFCQRGGWAEVGPAAMTKFMGEDVNGATLGVIGFGRIGQEIAKRARGFDMRVVYSDVARNVEAENNISAEYVPLNVLLQQADFVSVSCPLNEHTRHLIRRETLQLMKSTAFIVSTARGPVIDSDALYEAITKKKIAGAGLDVVEGEPIDKSHLLIGLPNVIIVPHIGAAARGSNRRMAMMAAEEVARALRGDAPRNPLNAEVLKGVPNGTS